MAQILEVKALTKRFGGLTAVNDVSFAVNEKEILSVIGPNGAGKSTLFKLISSFLSPTSGEVTFKGERISNQSPHIAARKGVVRTFQETTIFRNMSVRDNVIVAHQLRARASLLGFFLGSAEARRDEARFAESADEILSFLGLDGIGGQAGEGVDGQTVELIERVLSSQRAQMDALADIGEVGQMVGPPAVEVEQHDLPADAFQLSLGTGIGARQLLDEFGVAVRREFLQLLARRRRAQQGVAPLDDDRALLGDQLVVAPGVGVHIQKPTLGDALGVIQQRGGLGTGGATGLVALVG